MTTTHLDAAEFTREIAGDLSKEIAWRESDDCDSAGSESTLSFCAIAEVLTSQLPITSLMRRFAEALSDELQCRQCGLAVRTTQDEVVVLSMSSREPNGQRAPWREVSTPSENGGPTTIHVRSQGATVVVDDFTTVSRDLFDPTLTKQGIRSALVLPMKQSKTDYGSLGLYHDSPRQFTADEVQFVENARNLLMLVVERSWLEHNLRTADLLHDSVLQSTQTPFVLMRADGKLVDINRAMQVMSGFTREEILGRYFASLFATATETDKLAAILDQAGSDAVCLDCRMLTKHGQVRQITWTFVAVTLPNGQRRHLATGVDITDQTAAVERAAHAQRQIEKLRQLMLALKSAVAGGDIDHIRREMIEMEKRSGDEDGRKSSADEKVDRKRRSSARVSFQSSQRIAPIIHGKTPAQKDFVSVQCVDLSVGGIAFLLPTAPTVQEYLVALGTGETAVQLRAEVRNARRTMENGQYVFRVGCQFKDRVRRLPPGV